MSTTQDFINSIYPYAVDNYKKYGILPSITIAQAAHESDYGRSSLARSANNLFGVKGVGTAGSVQMNTTEEIKGKTESVQDYFRKYFSVEDSVNDYGKLLNTERYTNVKNAPNYKSAAFALYNAGYATDSGYPGKIISIVEQNQLYKIDNEVKTGNTSTSSVPASKLIQSSSKEDSSTSSFGGIFNTDNWTNFLNDVLYKAAFFIPALIFLALGLYFLFSEQINSAAKAYVTGGLSLVAEGGKQNG